MRIKWANTCPKQQRGILSLFYRGQRSSADEGQREERICVRETKDQRADREAEAPRREAAGIGSGANGDSEAVCRKKDARTPTTEEAKAT